MHLIVVESPAKAKTISKYLLSGYKVVASYGHVRDLLSKDGSVLPDDNFSMVWDVKPDGKKHLQDISNQLKSCDELLLATDPDREGEAISWHIKELLYESRKLNVPFKRIVFHEVTKGAIKEALANPRDLDQFLVDAYLARRALDYLVGFTISPILWRKLPGSKSAGRVQSVALRIIVDREAEIEAFKKKEYWSIEAKFEAKNKKIFDAKLMSYKGRKLDKFSIPNETEALSLKELLLLQKFTVESVESKVVKRNPVPAFITSTLQQEASRKLGFSARKTMQLAQNLYEGVSVDGETIAFITYMRTDSVNLSKEAIASIRDLVAQKYGKDFLPEKPRFYQTKVKNAQEAHEAIRPVDTALVPDSMRGKISTDHFKLYDLIWKRAVASQMASAEFDQVQVDISDNDRSTFRANGNTLKFEGFIKVYMEGKDDAAEEEAEGLLPPLIKGDSVPMKNLEALQHFTIPPPRFSEASLVKKLEELGIGRPSTYASILQVLQDRGYAKLAKKFFVPEIRGRLVTVFLTNFFNKYLEYGFTAELEQSLDDISNGTKSKLETLRNFWTEFSENVTQTKEIKISEVIDKLNTALESFLFQREDGSVTRECPECKSGELSLKIGRFGAFLGCSCYPVCGYVKRLDSATISESDSEVAQSAEYPVFLGVDSSDGSEISLRKGPYGIYVQKDRKVDNNAPDASDETAKSGARSGVKSAGKSSAKDYRKSQKPMRASLPSFIDRNSINISIALSLLQFPKILGQHEGEDVKIGIGKFGPYVLFKGKYVSAPKSEAIFSMTLDNAIALVRASKKTKSK
ncbi:MAG: type I DNA topoisomerase [Holosporaceae bacterium]|jgi:DNA topoisomerase-1|nr:type I DNA topoisomerase [Holosporaceae bacterium]